MKVLIWLLLCKRLGQSCSWTYFLQIVIAAILGWIDSELPSIVPTVCEGGGRMAGAGGRWGDSVRLPRGQYLNVKNDLTLMAATDQMIISDQMIVCWWAQRSLGLAVGVKILWPIGQIMPSAATFRRKRCQTVNGCNYFACLAIISAQLAPQQPAPGQLKSG